jgi:centromeric protein E
MQKPENLVGLSPNADSESSASGSPASCSKSSQNRVMFSDMKDGQRKSISRRGEESAVVDSYPERTQAGDLFSVTVGGRRLPPVRGILTTTFLCFILLPISVCVQRNLIIICGPLHHIFMGKFYS